jgi:translation initiation factor 2 gamma subunit (eIF-2gamma)
MRGNPASLSGHAAADACTRRIYRPRRGELDTRGRKKALTRAVDRPFGKPEDDLDPVARTAVAHFFAHPQEERNAAAVALQHLLGGGLAAGLLDLQLMVEARPGVGTADEQGRRLAEGLTQRELELDGTDGEAVEAPGTLVEVGIEALRADLEGRGRRSRP